MKNIVLTTILLLFTSTLIAQNKPAPFIGTIGGVIPRGENLRVLRLAVSCTGEYTTEVGGVASASANIDAWLVQINQVYGREYCVQFELIPNNDLLIYTDANTDPWPDMSGGSGCNNSGNITGIQATVIDGIIGAANYDISHVILSNSFGGGCAGGFKSGYSGGLDIPVTRHEMGHQFGQSHTISNSGNNNYEPQNGAWSIQGGNGQPYAHSESYHQLAYKLAIEEPNTGTKVITGNTIPTVSAGPDVAIPISTPYMLKATASDPDPGDVFTYAWDYLDRGIQQSIPVADDSQGPLFMRLLPTTNAVRYIPNINDVIANISAGSQEQLPTQARDMNIRLTVNDSHMISYNNQTIGASGINCDDVKITVAGTAGPFVVLSPNTAVTYTTGTNETISWNVAGTDTAPVNCALVDIRLSVDGGLTYPYSLATDTPNDGSENVLIHESISQTTTARVKVECASFDNVVFYDISNSDFIVNSTCQANGGTISPTTAVSAPPGNVALNLSPTVNYGGNTPPVNYSYTYVAVNTETDLIDAVNPNADFTSLVGGTYRIYGMSYNSTNVPPNIALMQKVEVMQNSGFCISFSQNYIDLKVEVCNLITVIPMAATPCTPATNTYNQDIKIIYEYAPTSGFIDVNGQTFSITGSPQFETLTALIADSQSVDITASFSVDPSCTYFQANSFSSPVSDKIAGTALNFDPPSGETEYVTLDGININTNTLTLMAWVKPNGLQNSSTGIIFSNNPTEGTGLNFNDNTNELGIHWKGSQWWWNSGLFVPADEWSHVALVVNVNSATVYLNGVPSVNNSISGTTAFSEVQIGTNRGWSDRNFNGLMDDVRIYDIALSTQQVRENMHIIEDVCHPNLLAYYQFNDSNGLIDKTNKTTATIKGNLNLVPSEAPVAEGTAVTKTVTATGTYDFNTPTDANLSINFTGTPPNGDVVVSQLTSEGPHGTSASNDPLSPAYWIVRNFGANNTGLNATMTFQQSGWATSSTATDYQLYKRASNATGAWNAPIAASTANGGTGEVSFTNINDFSQFIISNNGTTGGCTDVVIEVKLDNYPQETTWELRNATTAIVASGGPYSDPADNNQLISVMACLPPGCYDFTINDTYGDGICCGFGNGYYTVYHNTNKTVYASGANGGAFGMSETINFCMPFVCPTNRTVNNAFGNGHYTAANNATSTGIATSGSNSVLEAGNSIDLNPNFKVELNTDFEARIVPCNAAINEGNSSSITVADNSKAINNEKTKYLDVISNPLTGNLEINYHIKELSTVQLGIYNNQGQLVQKPLNNLTRNAGYYTVKINLSDLKNGLYWIKLETETQKLSEKIIIQK